MTTDNNENSMIENSRAQVYVILDTVPPYAPSNWMAVRTRGKTLPPLAEMEDEQMVECVMKVMKTKKCHPKHGDVIAVGSCPGDDRNRGTHFWDDTLKTIIPMETCISDYGHVPAVFKVGKGPGEFSTHHWDEISNYNNFEPYWSAKKNDWFYPSNGENAEDNQ